eukprot:2906139-Amphidinium_carterae.1
MQHKQPPKSWSIGSGSKPLNTPWPVCKAWRQTRNFGSTWQHKPFESLGSVIGAVHKVGKHHTSLQNVLENPPDLPVAP